MWQNTVRNVCQLKKMGKIVHAHEMLKEFKGIEIQPQVRRKALRRTKVQNVYTPNYLTYTAGFIVI